MGKLGTLSRPSLFTTPMTKKEQASRILTGRRPGRVCRKCNSLSYNSIEGVLTQSSRKVPISIKLCFLQARLGLWFVKIYDASLLSPVLWKGMVWREFYVFTSLFHSNKVSVSSSVPCLYPLSTWNLPFALFIHLTIRTNWSKSSPLFRKVLLRSWGCYGRKHCKCFWRPEKTFQNILKIVLTDMIKP